MTAPGTSIGPPLGEAELTAARALILAYAESLSFSLCFQGFDAEMARFPTDYQPPHGALLLARREGEPVGVVAVRRLEGPVSEMKRLYLRPDGRGLGLGRALVGAAVQAGRDLGYRSMRLDSIEGVQDRAIGLYRAHGFRSIPPYRDNPVSGVLYLECDLTENDETAAPSAAAAPG